MLSTGSGLVYPYIPFYSIGTNKIYKHVSLFALNATFMHYSRISFAFITKFTCQYKINHLFFEDVYLSIHRNQGSPNHYIILLGN